MAGSGNGVGGALRNRSTSRCSRKPTVIGTAIRHRRQGNLSHRRTQIDGVLHHNRLYGVEVAVQFNHRVVVGTTVVGQTGVRLEVLNTAEVGVERTNSNGLNSQWRNSACEVHRDRCLHPVVVFHNHRNWHGGNGIKTHVLYYHLGGCCRISTASSYSIERNHLGVVGNWREFVGTHVRIGRSVGGTLVAVDIDGYSQSGLTQVVRESTNNVEVRCGSVQNGTHYGIGIQRRECRLPSS